MAKLLLEPGDEVKNKQGTSLCDPTGPYTSWKDYWEKQSGQSWPQTCIIKGCDGEASVGAHVYANECTYKVFIVPMCASCNSHHNDGWMTVKGRRLAVEIEKWYTTLPEFCSYYW